MTLAGLWIAAPVWLWLLIPAFWLSRRVAALRWTGLARFAEPPLWPWLLRTPRRVPGTRVAWPFFFACTLAILALSRPYLLDGPFPTPTRVASDIVLVIDISPSMAATDLTPDRLRQAQMALQDLLPRLDQARIGLVVYSAQAYRLLPLSSDRPLVAEFVTALDTGMIRRQGSNLPDALAYAQRLLADSREGARAILLVSDGETTRPEALTAVMDSLRADRIPVFTIAVGTDAGAALQDPAGRLILDQGTVHLSRVDTALLAGLAQASGGEAIRLEGHPIDWTPLSQGLTGLARHNRYPAPAEDATALFPALILAALLMFLGARLGRTAPLVIALLTLPWLTPEPAQALPWQSLQAYQALQRGDYVAARTRYRGVSGYEGLIGLGVAAYRLQAWTEALEAFERAAASTEVAEEQARSHYNRGNTLVQLQRLGEAEAAYQQTLRLQPGHRGAAHNLELIRRYRTAAGPRPARDAAPRIDPRGEPAAADPAQGRSQGRSGPPYGAPPASPLETRSDDREVTATTSAVPAEGDADPLYALARYQRRALREDIDAVIRDRIAREDRRPVDPAAASPW